MPLSDVIIGIYQRLNMQMRFFVTAQITFGKGELNVNAVTFFCPGVNINAYIGFVFEQGQQIRYFLFPYNVFRPSIHINRASFDRYRIVIPAEVSHSERCHESHQFYCRQIILPLYNPDQRFMFHRVLLRIGGRIAGDIDHCDF